jgi:hypothetical protein
MLDLGPALELAAGAPALARRALATASAALAGAAVPAAEPGDAAAAGSGPSMAMVSGRVRDAAGNPVANALVRITELEVGTTSRADGSYRLMVPEARLAGRGTHYRVSVVRERVVVAEQGVELAPGARVTLDLELGGGSGGGSSESYSFSDASGSAMVSGDVPGRVASVWAMARNAPPAAAAQGLGRLAFADPEPRVARAAVQALASLAAPEAIPALERIARDHPNAAIRREARAAARP